MFAVTRGDELVMAEASREGYREPGRVRPGIKLGRPRQPTIVNGRLYLRGDREAVCYRITPQRRKAIVGARLHGSPPD
ncbi:MAG: hypothetical protein KJZ87_00950 [Thermoguttaceae bacterium]|nr:hypothetical protein [Thermoguttaceae bacterium]